MKALFGLWPWRTQASSNGKNSDYPPILMNGYETTCDQQEQLKLHLVQTNLTQSADNKVQTIKFPLSSNPRIMPALLRLDSTGEISSVNHHNDSNLACANKYKTKSRSLGSFVAPKMSLNKNFVSPVLQRNFSMPFAGQVHSSKTQPFQSPVDSWHTTKNFHCLSKSNSFPKVKDYSISLDYIQPKNPSNLFGNTHLYEKMASMLDHLWTTDLSQPTTQLSQAATSDSTVGRQLSHNSSSVIPSSNTMISNISSVPSHSTTESESMDSFNSQKQKAELLHSPEEHTSKSSTKCHTSEQDNESPNRNNPSIDIPSSSNISHSGGDFLPSVLNTPRKIVKKGRPSSKKQKKRQRQKQKNACRSSPNCEISGINENRSESLDRSSSLDIVFTSDESPNVHGCQFKAPRASTPVKDLSKHSEIDSCVVFTLESDSDESDIEFDGCDWSPVESSKVDTSPNDDAVFNVTLSLDTIFKQTSIPSLKSILSDEGSSESSTPLLSPTTDKGKNGLCVINFSFSEDDCTSTQELYDVCDSSPSSSCFFQLTPGLCLDRLFPSNSRLTNLELDQVDSAELPCSTFITEINAKWNLNYPSAGFRSCQSVCKDQIDNPSIKVHFAAEPDLLTVHVVGTEDRCGTWQLYALDRDRFDRRIQEAMKVISPVLDHQHRAKIVERNAQLLVNLENR